MLWANEEIEHAAGVGRLKDPQEATRIVSELVERLQKTTTIEADLATYIADLDSETLHGLQNLLRRALHMASTKILRADIAAAISKSSECHYCGAMLGEPGEFGPYCSESCYLADSID